MKALLVSYDLKNADIRQKTKIHMTLYDYKDYSNGGRYNYLRKGMLSKYPSIKLNRGVFIIRLIDKKKILPVLKDNKANIKTLIVGVSSKKLIRKV